MTYHGWTADEAIRRIQEVAHRIGHEPSTGDMGGNVGACCRLFGSWENAKEIAGVKGYIAPEEPKPEIMVVKAPFALSAEELQAEREAWRARRKEKANQEAAHEGRIFQFCHFKIGKGFNRKLREDEYLPPRDAILVARR